MKVFLRDRGCAYYYYQQWGFGNTCEFQFSILNLSPSSLTAVKPPQKITCSLQSHDLWHSQPFCCCWLEKIAESLACFPSKKSSCKFPKSYPLIPSIPAQPNGGSYLFFVQREGALFLPSTLLIFPSLFVTNTSLVLALLQKIVGAKKNWGCLEACRASILLLTKIINLFFRSSSVQMVCTQVASCHMKISANMKSKMQRGSPEKCQEH